MLVIFPSLAGMSLTKLFLAGNNLIIPGQGKFGDIPAGDGKIFNIFYSDMLLLLEVVSALKPHVH
jgi:hypothetical protein